MKKKISGLGYVIPWLAGIIIFKFYPIIYSLVLSFTDGNIFGKPNFSGLENYARLFLDDEFIRSLTVTLIYVFIEVPLKLAVSLIVAYVLSANIKGIGFFRTAYYIPAILGSNIAVAVLWKYIFAYDGYANQIVKLFGIEPISWFGEPFPALMTIILLRVWEFGSTMVIFLAALNEVPKEIYDSAEIDGCTGLSRVFRITIPLIKPIILFNFVMQIIQAFQEFNAPYMITGGAPMKSTYLVSMMIYDNSFIYFDMGYASAASWTVLIVVSVIVFALLKLFKIEKND